MDLILKKMNLLTSHTHEMNESLKKSFRLTCAAMKDRSILLLRSSQGTQRKMQMCVFFFLVLLSLFFLLRASVCASRRSASTVCVSWRTSPAEHVVEWKERKKRRMRMWEDGERRGTRSRWSDGEMWLREAAGTRRRKKRRRRRRQTVT